MKIKVSNNFGFWISDCGLKRMGGIEGLADLGIKEFRDSNDDEFLYKFLNP
jgi:hypothetical protein